MSLVQPFDMAVARWLTAQANIAFELSDVAEVQVDFTEAVHSDDYGYTADAEVTVRYSLYGKVRKDGSRGRGKYKSVYAGSSMVDFAQTLMNEYGE